MKSEWTMKKLYEIVDFNPKESIKKGDIAKKVAMDQLVPFCRDVKGYVEKEFSGGVKFRNGDTIMARITPCLENGKIAQVSILEDGEIGFGSTEYIVFRAKAEIADSNYIYYLVCSPVIKEPAIKSMVGSSGRQRVQLDVVQNLDILVPPLDEQKKIGIFLSKMDEKISLNNKINDNLSEQMSTIVSYSKEVSSWKNRKLNSILEFYDYKRKPLSSKQRATMQGLYPYYGATTIVDYINSFLFEGTYILISEDGANVVDEQGHPLIQYTHGKFWLNNHAHIVKGCNGFSEALIYALMLTLNLQSIVTGAAQPKINQANLRNFQTPLPEISEAQKLSELVSPLLEQMITNDQENVYLSQIRDTLLPRLMSGELNISDLNL